MDTSDDNPRLADNPYAPEVFASNATGFLAIGDSVVITLECGKSDYTKSPPEIVRHVVARLVMPRGGAEGLAIGLFEFLKQNDATTTAGGSGASVQ